MATTDLLPVERPTRAAKDKALRKKVWLRNGDEEESQTTEENGDVGAPQEVKANAHPQKSNPSRQRTAATSAVKPTKTAASTALPKSKQNGKGTSSNKISNLKDLREEAVDTVKTSRKPAQLKYTPANLDIASEEEEDGIDELPSSLEKNSKMLKLLKDGEQLEEAEEEDILTVDVMALEKAIWQGDDDEEDVTGQGLAHGPDEDAFMGDPDDEEEPQDDAAQHGGDGTSSGGGNGAFLDLPSKITNLEDEDDDDAYYDDDEDRRQAHKRRRLALEKPIPKSIPRTPGRRRPSHGAPQSIRRSPRQTSSQPSPRLPTPGQRRKPQTPLAHTAPEPTPARQGSPFYPSLPPSPVLPRPPPRRSGPTPAEPQRQKSQTNTPAKQHQAITLPAPNFGGRLRRIDGTLLSSSSPRPSQAAPSKTSHGTTSRSALQVTPSTPSNTRPTSAQKDGRSSSKGDPSTQLSVSRRSTVAAPTSSQSRSRTSPNQSQNHNERPPSTRDEAPSKTPTSGRPTAAAPTSSQSRPRTTSNEAPSRPPVSNRSAGVLSASGQSRPGSTSTHPSKTPGTRSGTQTKATLEGNGHAKGRKGAVRGHSNDAREAEDDPMEDIPEDDDAEMEDPQPVSKLAQKHRKEAPMWVEVSDTEEPQKPKRGKKRRTPDRDESDWHVSARVQGTTLADLHETLRAVVKSAIDIALEAMAMVTAWPTYGARKDYVRELMKEAAAAMGRPAVPIQERLEQDTEFPGYFVGMIMSRIPVERGGYKDDANKAMVDVFGLKNKTEEQARNGAKTWLKDDNYVFPPWGEQANKLNLNLPYNHPVLQMLTCKMAFLPKTNNFYNYNPKRFEVTYDDETLSEFPAPMVALAATAFHAALVDWSTEGHPNKMFTGDMYQGIYEGHRFVLNRLREKKPDVYHEAMTTLFEAAQEFLPKKKKEKKPVIRDEKLALLDRLGIA